MKTALITTTINVPTVLALYRKLGPSGKFFVAADHKTPREAYEFCADIPDCEIYSPERQKECGYECSELLGWSTITRRNIALLEALKWGAELIVTIDDDNIPCGVLKAGAFVGFHDIFEVGKNWHGLQTNGLRGWFDPGNLLVPQIKHRGYPSSVLSTGSIVPITDARIGVAEGLIIGDADMDAVTRIASHPAAYGVSEVGRAGVVVDPRKTWTVFNTQNTAYLRELAPAMGCFPQLGRYDDIYASLLTQKIMRTRGLCVHFGQPLVWQERNAHDLLKDLAAEKWGAEHILEFVDYLERTPIQGIHSVTDDCRDLMANCPIFSDDLKEVAEAWYNDVERVL